MNRIILIQNKKVYNWVEFLEDSKGTYKGIDVSMMRDMLDGGIESNSREDYLNMLLYTMVTASLGYCVNLLIINYTDKQEEMIKSAAVQFNAEILYD